MTGGQAGGPQSPIDFPGPAPSPTSDSLAALALDVNQDKDVKLMATTALVAQTSFNLGVNATKSEKKSSYPWWAILIYVFILLISVVIYFLPSTTADHKNQALGFLFGQTSLLFANFFKKGEKD
jgi:hypothetical protein